MIETHLNIVDAVVLGVMALSCLFAFFRGFVREILSLSAWLGAGLVTMYYFPTVAAKMQTHFKSETVAAGVGTLAMYISALMGFTILNMLIIKLFKSGPEIGLFDNLLGLAFGVFRGAFIVSLGFFLLTIAVPEKEYPDWLKQSVTRPYAEKGAVLLAKIAPEYLREVSTIEKKAVTEASADHSKNEGTAFGDEKDDTTPKENTGYSRAATNQLGRLLGSTSKEK